MKKRNHITFAGIIVLVFLLILGYFSVDLIKITPGSVFIIGLITVFYSLLPDIDHKNSTITWWFFGIGILGLLMGILELYYSISLVSPLLLLIASTLFLVCTFLAANIFEHRGIIHSIPVGILSAVPLYFIFSTFSYPIIAYVAWHSHLIGDGYLLKFK